MPFASGNDRNTEYTQPLKNVGEIGYWKGYRDIHIEPDWLLIYKRDEKNIWLVRTGAHADLFG
jgi:addiction module RelE/StbE family toxin